MDKVEGRNIDLHAHSDWSDGSDTPAALAKHAKACGLAAFALTDHDTIAGVPEAQTRAAELGIECMAGMELTVQYGPRRLHIVALGFDETHPAFQEMYAHARALKEQGMAGLIEELRRGGLNITVDDVAKFSKSGGIDRYAILRYLITLGEFDDVQKYWDAYLNPAFDKHKEYNRNISAEEGLAAIRAAGGINSLAHFHKRIGLKGLTRAAQEDAMRELLAMGLDGMELQYPNYSEEDCAFAAYLTDKYAMTPTAGSDYHGVNRPGVELGSGTDGNIRAPYAMLTAIREKIATRKSR